MKIIDNTGKTLTFGDLDIGAVFKYKTYVAMKMEEVRDADNPGETVSAVELSNGEALILYGHEIVEPVDATLTINRKEN